MAKTETTEKSYIPKSLKARKTESYKNTRFERKQRDKEKEENDRLARLSKKLLLEDQGYLVPEGNDEQTFQITQQKLRGHLDLQTQRRQFNLDLPDLGPYSIDYSPNGRHLLIGGRKGHVATFDWTSGKLGCEIQLQETCRDVHWLHNETMFAVAQAKYTFIYDHTGLELHKMKKFSDVTKLDYLRYHFMLVSVGNAGMLRYQDTSTGQLVAELKTRLGSCSVLGQNPQNAIMHLGHGNGTVTLWSPNMSTPLVKMLCHRGPVQALAVDIKGHHMVTSGTDGQVKVWDLRTYNMLHSYYSRIPANTISISQRGLLAVGWGSHVSIWKNALEKKQLAPYMNELLPSTQLSDIAFAPFEDVLGVGSSRGFSSLVVPGAGEPNFDAFELNPFQTTKQRQEGEVRQLLEKLQPEMIMLDPEQIATVKRPTREKELAIRQIAANANNVQSMASMPAYMKQAIATLEEEQYDVESDESAVKDGAKVARIREKRKKQRANRRLRAKADNVIDAKREKARERMAREQEESKLKSRGIDVEAAKRQKASIYDPLDRFQQ